MNTTEDRVELTLRAKTPMGQRTERLSEADRAICREIDDLRRMHNNLRAMLPKRDEA